MQSSNASNTTVLSSLELSPEETQAALRAFWVYADRPVAQKAHLSALVSPDMIQAGTEAFLEWEREHHPVDETISEFALHDLVAQVLRAALSQQRSAAHQASSCALGMSSETSP